MSSWLGLYTPTPVFPVMPQCRLPSPPPPLSAVPSESGRQGGGGGGLWWRSQDRAVGLLTREGLTLYYIQTEGHWIFGRISCLLTDTICSHYFPMITYIAINTAPTMQCVIRPLEVRLRGWGVCVCVGGGGVLGGGGCAGICGSPYKM